ncbi:MAG: hypothetical protein WC828_07260 [Thermoleophilia bacterium]
MLIPHACLNAAVGQLFKSPAKALVTGVALHAILDLVPHKDVAAHKAEGALVLIMLGLIGSSCGYTSPAFLCAMGGVLPDVEQVLPWTDPKRGRHRWFITHNKPFHSIRIPGAREYRVKLMTQSLVSITALTLAITMCRGKKCT